MPNKNEVSKAIYIRWFVLRAILIVYDIIAVNAAFYLALLTRFYVAQEVNSAASAYFTTFSKYAPIYTVFCLAVFLVFRLYSGIWKAAGLSDLNRVFIANLICTVGHVAGTLIFGIRMPITFYCIGAVIQLVLITICRFSYSLLLVEKKRFSRGDSLAVNTMVIGMGDTARSAVRAMEQDGAVRPVCIVDYRNESFGAMFDGVPVVTGVSNMAAAIEKYQVKLVLLASLSMPQEVRSQIHEICTQCGVDSQDYVGYFQNTGSGISLKSMAECCSGPVEIAVGGNTRKFESCEQAMLSITGKYLVKSVAAKGGALCIELTSHDVVQNDLNEEWVKTQEAETGEEISFF